MNSVSITLARQQKRSADSEQKEGDEVTNVASMVSSKGLLASHQN